MGKKMAALHLKQIRPKSYFSPLNQGQLTS